MTVGTTIPTEPHLEEGLFLTLMILNLGYYKNDVESTFGDVMSSLLVFDNVSFAHLNGYNV